MPIEFDENKSTEELEESLQHIVLKSKVTGMGQFSKHLTGNGLTSSGLFRKDESSPLDFTEEVTNLIGTMNHHVSGHYESVARYVANNQFYTMQKDYEYDKESPAFQHAETAWLYPLPPSILYNALTIHNQKAKKKNYLHAFELPKTSLYDMEHVDTWTKIGNAMVGNEKVSVRMKLIIDHAFIYKRKADGRDKTAKGRKTAAILGYYPIVAVTYDNHATHTIRLQKEVGKIDRKNRINQNGQHQMAFKKAGTNGLAFANMFMLKENTTRNNLTFQVRDFQRDVEEFVGSIGCTNQNVEHSLIYHALKNLSIPAMLDEQAAAIDNVNEMIETYYEHILIPFAKFQTEAMKVEQNDPKSVTIAHANEVLKNAGQLMEIANKIETDICTTEDYAKRFLQIKKHLTQNQIEKVISYSLRAQLSERLHTLNTIKMVGGLYQFKVNDPAVKTRVEQAKTYSPAQKKIILSEEPLVIAQAGAGSGKSHTLVGRINYLEAQKEDLSSIMVLSFTNIAAKNIKQRFNGVRSETLARMFKDIYELNHPKHNLTHPSTMINAIEALNKKSGFFRQRGLKDENVINAANILMSALNDFSPKGFASSDTQAGIKKIKEGMSNYYNEMIAICDAIEQTTLEMQPIVLHHMIRHMNNQLQFPHTYQNLNYIITDESQDISTFEYIMLLELTIHFGSQLWIIGDGSQTLYEFRNSDPRYMNALESSNVFKTFKLETNYRSNQAVLSVANQFLQVIDANKNAKIQLQSANLQTITKKDIEENIKIEDIVYGRGDKIEELIESIEHDNKKFVYWLLDKLDKDEQVAVMAWSRKECNAMEVLIESIISKTKHKHTAIHNITKERKRPFDTFSLFANKRQNEMFALKAQNANFEDKVIETIKEFIGNYYHRGSDKMRDYLKRRLLNFFTHIVNSAEYKILKKEACQKKNELSNKKVSAHILREFIREETRMNTVDQLIDQNDNEVDTTKMKILVSTIHGTKGLEFDNTVVLFNEEKRNATSQEALRMFFVALSRAKKSEYILNFRYRNEKRVIGSNESDMFHTPMHTARLRAIRDVTINNGANSAVTMAD